MSKKSPTICKTKGPHEFGIELVAHPQGFFYLVAYNDAKRSLGNSTMIIAFSPHGMKLKVC